MNLYKDETALASFGNALEEVQAVFNAGPATRNGATRSFLLKEVLGADLEQGNKGYPWG